MFQSRRIGNTLRPLLFVPFLALGLLLAACTVSGIASGVPPTNPPVGSPDPVAGTGEITQESEGGQVTVEVTWQGATAEPVFKVVMDTHAVDLDGYDLRQTAVLRTEDGSELRPTGWDAPKGGHHREGLLTFPSATPDGKPVVTAGRAIELIIRDVAGVPERKYRWII